MKRGTARLLVVLAFLAAPLAQWAEQVGKVYWIGRLDGSSASARTTPLAAFTDRLPPSMLVRADQVIQ